MERQQFYAAGDPQGKEIRPTGFIPLDRAGGFAV
jgi:hypothetical protein